MSLWEYKVISSGKGGFATPALLEKFLNDLGRDEWEIIEFRTAPENLLAFSGLARRTTQRDWTLQDAAAAAAKAEAEKLRAEFEAKFKAATTTAPAAAEERAPSFLEEKAGPDDGFRKPVDTSHDDEPEAREEEKDDWDKLTAAEEDELPTFFEAIKPHMRRNQRGPGMSVGVDYLAKKWDQAEDDIKAALAECGFVMPEDEDSKVEHLEYDGDLYWLNINRRGELWINTKEKPRQIFRSVKGTKAVVEEQPPRERERDRDRDREPKPESGGGGAEKPESGDRKPEGGEVAAEGGSAENKAQSGKPEGGGGGAALPQGADLLAKIRPHMRRNRRGPGGSGSTTFLSRAMRTKEDDLKAAFVALGLTLPAHPNDKPVYTELGNELWWLNVDSRGGLWINGREKKHGESAASASKDDEARTAEEAKTADSAASAEGAAPASAAPEGTAPAPAGDSQAQFVAMEVAPQPAAVAPAAPTPVPETAAPAEPAPTPAPAAEGTPPPPVDTIASDAPDTPRAAPDAPAEDSSAEAEGEKKTRRPRTRKKAE